MATDLLTLLEMCLMWAFQLTPFGVSRRFRRGNLRQPYRLHKNFKKKSTVIFFYDLIIGFLTPYGVSRRFRRGIYWQPYRLHNIFDKNSIAIFF